MADDPKKDEPDAPPGLFKGLQISPETKAKMGLTAEKFEGLSKNLAGIMAAYPGLGGQRSEPPEPEEPDEPEEPVGEMAGAPEVAPRSNRSRGRSRGGKVTTRGRHRRMNHWEIFDSELNELGGLRKDAQRAYAWAAFFGAVALDLWRDIATSADMVGQARVFWVVIAIVAALSAVKCFLDGRYWEKRGDRRLQEIKDEHDDD